MARSQAAAALVDLIGVTLAGSREASSKLVTKFARREGGSGSSVVIGHGFRTSPSLAALINGTSSHVLDYDDTGLSFGHASSAIVPGTLAIADEVGASGPELLEAMIVGYEIASRVGRASGGLLGSSRTAMPEDGWEGGPYARGFHGTSIFGIFGVAAAAGRLLQLSVEELRNAFGIAASEASGVRANFGTMAKGLHSGLCGRSGVMAALLARDGFTANQDALEARYGWGHAIAGKVFDPEALTAGLGDGLAIEQGVDFKRYASCGGSHVPIDAVRGLMAQEGLGPDDIESLEIDVASYVAREILLYPWPANGLESKFSVAYAAAAAWRDAEVTVESFSDHRVAELAPYRTRVTIVAQEGRPPVVARAHTTDGRVLSYENTVGRADMRGGHLNPHTRDELRAKFHENAARGGTTRTDADEILDALESIHEAKGVSTLTDLL